MKASGEVQPRFKHILTATENTHLCAPFTRYDVDRFFDDSTDDFSAICGLVPPAATANFDYFDATLAQLKTIIESIDTKLALMTQSRANDRQPDTTFTPAKQAWADITDDDLDSSSPPPQDTSRPAVVFFPHG